MATIKDFIKKIGNETVSLEEQQKALAAVEKTIVEAKAKREESIGKNVDLVVAALKKIESDLEAKLVELNNTPAKQGVQGPQGPAGKDGRDGKDGYAGRDGKDGVDGVDGEDGKDGISVTDAKIDFDGSLVITLSDGREIDAGTVIPLDVAKQIHSVSTNGGGTSQSVLDAIADLQTQITSLSASAVTVNGTQTLTNKRINPRVNASTANSATPTLNTDSYDMMVITAQSVAITSFTTNLSGTPVNGQKLWISVTGTGAIAITWGASFESSTATLPTTTVSTNRLDVGFVWNVATTKWRCVAVA